MCVSDKWQGPRNTACTNTNAPGVSYFSGKLSKRDFCKEHQLQAAETGFLVNFFSARTKKRVLSAVGISKMALLIIERERASLLLVGTDVVVDTRNKVLRILGGYHMHHN